MSDIFSRFYACNNYDFKVICCFLEETSLDFNDIDNIKAFREEIKEAIFRQGSENYPDQVNMLCGIQEL